MDNAEFEFMNVSVRLKDDTKFVNIHETLTALTYVFTRHLKVWIYIRSKYNDTTLLTGPNLEIDAGRVYNNLFITHGSDKELSQEVFQAICTTFKEFISRNADLRINHYVRNIQDPFETMWALCKYFFVPSRLNDMTIPKEIRVISLRKWLSIVFVLPFIRDYGEKFANVIPNIFTISNIYEKFINNSAQIDKLMQTGDTLARKAIGTVYNQDVMVIQFIRTFMHTFLMCTTEILKRYCPNYHKCVQINPNYDGTWINFYDSVYTTQYAELTKLVQYVECKQNA